VSGGVGIRRSVLPIVMVNLKRVVGDRRLLLVATCFPVLLILVTGLLAGSPKEPVGLVHPSARLVQLAERSGDVSVKIEPDRSALVDDILRGRVVAGLVWQTAPRDHVRVDFLTETAQTDSVQARTDMVALLDLMAAEGPHRAITDTTLAHTRTAAPLSPFAYVAPADLVLFLGITLLVLSSELVESRRLGILRRLSAAPMRQGAVVAAQIASRMLVAAGQSAGLLLVGFVLFGVHWGNPFAVGLVIALLALSLSGASVLIGIASRTDEQAVALSVVIGIAAGMLGGCMYPLDQVGTTVREVGHVVPQAWALDAFVRLINDHATFAAVLPDLGALAAFATGLTALAVWRYDSRAQ
jgi:ABC-2 type transport system permease protein